MKTRPLSQWRTWCVARTNDDGRVDMAVPALTAEAAQLIAGAMRDEMTDEQVGEGWNYEPRRAKEFLSRRVTTGGQ